MNYNPTQHFYGDKMKHDKAQPQLVGDLAESEDNIYLLI